MADLSASPSQRKTEDAIVDEIVKMHQRMSSRRANLESHWREVAERVWPSQSRLFSSGGRFPGMTQGEPRSEEMYDATASIALDRFAAILDSLLTPASQTWHRLQPSNPLLKKDRATELWFEDVNRILFKQRYAPMSNFIAQNQLQYKMLGAYGSGCLFADDLKNLRGIPTGIRYRNIHLSEIYFGENHQGLIDIACRYFLLEARQAFQLWGDKLPDGIREALNSSPDKEFAFIHCVKPTTDYDPERVDYKGMPYASYYVSVEGKKLLEEGGYEVFPYSISRYEQVPGETYGRSPAMQVLPAIKTLNDQKRTLLRQGHRALDPVLLTHDDGIIDTFSLRAGALNSGGVNADGRPLVHALPVGDILVGKDMMDMERSDIKDGFLVSIFQMLVDTPQMTATEVMERTREKGVLLAPTIGRQYSEYHSPLINRELNLLIKQKKIPPFPQMLIEAGGEYEVVYESPMTRTQKAEEAAGFMRVMETAMNIATQTQNPAPLDHFNWDQVIPDFCEIHGVPARWRNAMDEMEKIRAGRAKAAEQQQAIAAAPGAAAMMKASTVQQQNSQEMAAGVTNG